MAFHNTHLAEWPFCSFTCGSSFSEHLNLKVEAILKKRRALQQTMTYKHYCNV